MSQLIHMTRNDPSDPHDPTEPCDSFDQYDPEFLKNDAEDPAVSLSTTIVVQTGY